MIATLTGVLRSKSPTEIIIDVNGVGYSVSIPLSTFEKLTETGSTVTLLTHLQVREDALQLYGFVTEKELILFRMLISVSGIGPKIAQGVLSGISASDLREYIIKGNVAALTTIPGVGKKTAERMVVELRDKMSKDEPSAVFAGTPAARDDARIQALLALTSLGYSRIVAEKAIRQALTEANGAELSLEELIKRALKHTSTK